MTPRVDVNHLRIAVITIAATLLSSACASPGQHATTSSSTTPATPPQIPFNSVWSADNSIDLFTRPAELIRATQESLHLVKTYGLGSAFPGYLAAIGGPKEVNDPDYEYSVTSQEFKGPFKFALDRPVTNYYLLSDLSTSPDGKHITASVCRYILASPGTLDNRIYAGKRWAVNYVLDNEHADTHATSTPDRNPHTTSPAADMPPTWNVFGTWHIRQVHEIDRTPELPPACAPWWESLPPKLSHLPGGSMDHRPDDTALLPVAPVQPQFPEWIPADKR